MERGVADYKTMHKGEADDGGDEQHDVESVKNNG